MTILADSTVSTQIDEEYDERVKQILRGDGPNLETLKDKKLKGQLSVREGLYEKSAKAAAKAEKWLMPTEGGYLEAEGIEKTYRFKQETIASEVGIKTSRMIFDQILPDLGPYTLDFTPNGRYMLFGGRKGRLGIFDMQDFDRVKKPVKKPVKEYQVRETVRDVVFLHNESLFAAAQKKHTYIYNYHSSEVHCLEKQISVRRLQYLKHQFLLVSVNEYGQLHYRDTTNGIMVNNYGSEHGKTDVMQANQYNSVIALGHTHGSVTMWKPTMKTHLQKIDCRHRGPISAIAFHPNGQLMATAGKDKRVKIWDLRKLNDDPLQVMPGHANTMDFSDKGFLALASGSCTQVFHNKFGDQSYTRYLRHPMVKGYQIGKVCFRPYEDSLCMGHSMGVSGILVPGSGEPNFDSFVANPFETLKQKREKEIRSLLDKLPPETVALDPTKIGTVLPVGRREKPTRREREAEMDEAVDAAKGKDVKKKTKGRNKPSKRAAKKEEMVANAKRPFVDQSKDEELSRKKPKAVESVELLPVSLQRFAKKDTSA